MTRNLQSGTAIIDFDERTLRLLKGYCHRLLVSKQPNTRRYFQKISRLPKSLLYLKSYLAHNASYWDNSKIIDFYIFTTRQKDDISINAFYNLLTYLESKKVYTLKPRTLYEGFHNSKGLKNDLKEKQVVNNHIDIIKKIGV